MPRVFSAENSALWFGDSVDYGQNLVALFTFDNGIYLTWLGNSALYALAGGVGATVLAVLGWICFRQVRLLGRRFSFSLLLGAVMVPQTALVIPTFILLANMGLTKRSGLLSCFSSEPFGVYLMYVYAKMLLPMSCLTRPC